LKHQEGADDKVFAFWSEMFVSFSIGTSKEFKIPGSIKIEPNYVSIITAICICIAILIFAVTYIVNKVKRKLFRRSKKTPTEHFDEILIQMSTGVRTDVQHLYISHHEIDRSESKHLGKGRVSVRQDSQHYER